MITGFIEELSEYISKGGFVVMGVLVFAAMILWYALGYRLFVLKRGNRRNVRRLIEKYDAGNYNRKPSGVIDSAVVLGLKMLVEKGAPLRRRLDEAFSNYESEIAKYSILVKSIVAVSPLLGLLGTVDGMIETFDSLADMSLFSQSGGIAGGISQALFTTQMGLAVALPGLVVGRVLDRRQIQFEHELSKIKDILCSRAT